MTFARRFLLVALSTFVLGSGSVSYAQMLRPHEPLDPAKAQSLPLTPLEIETQDGARHKFSVEVADTPQTRATGLMHRVALPPDRGMLFDFGERVEVNMWMRNTFIPLDMLFMDEAGKVVYIAERTTPHSEKTIGPKRSVLSVLEVQAGTVARLGIDKGDTVHHPLFKNGP